MDVQGKSLPFSVADVKINVINVLGNFDKTHGHPVGNIDNVGDYGNCLRSFATEFRGMLVGCFDFGRCTVQWIWHLVRSQNL